MKIKVLASLILSILLSSCTSNNNLYNNAYNQFSIPSKYIFLPNFDQSKSADEILGRIDVYRSMLVYDQKMDKKKISSILYNIAILFDSLGLKNQAISSIEQSIGADPTNAQAYNLLGIYLLDALRFTDSYDAFDSAIDLDKSSTFFYTNRAYALYYGNRANLAKQDIDFVYTKSKDDPYVLLWSYIINQKLYGKDYAYRDLKQKYDLLKDKKFLAYYIIDYYLGYISLDQLFDNIQHSNIEQDKLIGVFCELYFYVGKMFEINKDYKSAYDFYNLSKILKGYDYSEYHLSGIEIELYKKHVLNQSVIVK